MANAPSLTHANRHQPGAADQILPAYAFAPESYGAVGNGKVLTDVVLNSTTTATSATAGFTSGDTGKTIMINGGLGTTGVPLVATITFSNSTTITLSVAATVTGSNFVAVYGTDDRSAINSAISAAGSYATANAYHAEVIFGAKIYMLTSGPTQSGNGTSTPTFNAQLPLPYPNVNGTSQKMVLQLTGAGDNGFFQFWESTTPNLAGTVLVSTLTNAPSTPHATFGIQSVIGGPSGSAGFTGGYANTKVVIRGIEVICPTYTNSYAYDFSFTSAVRIDRSSAHIFAPSGVNGGNSPLLKDLPGQAGFLNKIGTGIRTPTNGNNADVILDGFTVEGYSRGLYLNDHATCGRIGAVYNDVSLIVDNTIGVGGGTGHAVTIVNFCAEAYNGGILCNGGRTNLYINLDSENATVSYDISDSSNSLYGLVRFMDPANSSRVPTVTNASHLKIVNDNMGPGAWSGQPAVPSSTTNQQNTSWRDAAVSVKGGTVSVVAVDGVTCATATNTTVIVPAGKNITLTYSSAPTWAWTLL